MKKHGISIILWLLLLLVFSDQSWAETGAFRRVAEGDKAPDFQLKDNNGTKYKLSEFSGKVTGIVFWKHPSLRCPQELAILQELYQKYNTAKGYELIAVYVPQYDDKISAKELNEMKEVLNEAGVKYPNVIDVGMKTFDSYGVTMFPSYAVVKEDGRIGTIITGLPTFGGEKLIRRRTEALLGIEEIKKVAKKIKYKPKGKAGFYYDFARRMYLKGFNGKALSKLERVYQEDPDYYQPHRLAAIIYSAQKKKDKAIESFGKAVELAPSNIRLKMELAKYYTKNEMIDEAKEIYQEILEKNPEIPEGHYGMGVIYQKEEKLNEARKELEMAKELFLKQAPSDEDKKSFKPIRGHVHHLLGVLDKEQGNPENAFNEFVQACQIYDELVRTYLHKTK